jgi:hypothetical protein
MMSIDSINDEIRATRRKLAERFDNNLISIIADLRNRENSEVRTYVTRTYVTRPPRRIRRDEDEHIKD